MREPESGPRVKLAKDAGSVACFARERPRTPTEPGDTRYRIGRTLRIPDLASIPEPASAGHRAGFYQR
jgi:hypothetical protein